VSKLLVVDDEESICWGLSKLGKSIGHEVATASSAEQALDAVEDVQPDVIVLDVRLPGMDGLTAIGQFRERVGQIPIIVITAYGDLKTAVKAVRNGAFDYLVKPFDLEKVQRALMRAFASDHTAVSDQPRTAHVGAIVGRSVAIQEMFNHIALAAASDASILLCGESGTGKELAARAIHQHSYRVDGPFVAVNVASLSPSLAESELFGHVQGAFTGADQDRTGLLVQADSGTLFLDEVADIPLPVQVKLLRALDLGEVLPVGSGQSVKTAFRVVSATHQDLSAKVKEGSFRHDLYFRLGAFRIDIPSLRERRDDIGELAEHFLGTMLGVKRREDASIPALSEAALGELQQRPWYGNVRELRNALEHAVIVARGGVIEPDHLPEAVAASLLDIGDHEPPLEDSIATLIDRWAEAKLANVDGTEDLHEQLLRLIERPLFRVAIERHRGQCASAARRLGLHRTTLRKKLDEYGIDDQ